MGEGSRGPAPSKTAHPLEIEGGSSGERDEIFAATTIQSSVTPEEYPVQERQLQVAAATGQRPAGTETITSDKDAPAAFDPAEGDSPNFVKIRSAGPDGMRSELDEWDATDEASDESFPASDPPSH